MPWLADGVGPGVYFAVLRADSEAADPESEELPSELLGAQLFVCPLGVPTGRAFLESEWDFLAVDEVQLAAHPQRGHVFTDRLLRARGRMETWFMGSHTATPLLRELLPTARIERYPRLSSLTARGKQGLGALPPANGTACRRLWAVASE